MGRQIRHALAEALGRSEPEACCPMDGANLCTQCAAAWLRISVATFHANVRRELPSVKVGGRRIYPLSGLRAYSERHMEVPCHVTPSRTPSSDGRTRRSGGSASKTDTESPSESLSLIAQRRIARQQRASLRAAARQSGSQ